MPVIIIGSAIGTIVAVFIIAGVAKHYVSTKLMDEDDS